MSYLKQVISSAGKGGGVLMPLLAAFLDKEAIETSKDPKNKKRIVQKDSVLSIRCLRNRYSSFSHGQDKPEDGFIFHPSALGQCLRKLWFEHFNAPKDRKHKDDVLQTYVIFEFGTYLHIIIQNLCERAGVLLTREFQLKSKAHKIKGTCDGILKIADTKYVLEIKSINSGQWVKVQHGPKFDHRQQAMAYMKVLGLSWAIIVYVNKDRGTMKEYVIEYDEAFYKQYVRDRIDKYEKQVVFGLLPDREGTGPRSFPCSFCQFASFCFTPDSVKKFERQVRRQLNEN